MLLATKMEPLTVIKLAGTVYVGSNTALDFANNVFIQKVNEKGTFTHVIGDIHVLVNGSYDNKGVKMKPYQFLFRCSLMEKKSIQAISGKYIFDKLGADTFCKLREGIN